MPIARIIGKTALVATLVGVALGQAEAQVAARLRFQCLRANAQRSLALAAAGCGERIAAAHDHGHADDLAMQVSVDGLNGSLLPSRRLVLTYDDGPGRNTLAIATYLASYGIPATFFVNGCRFEGMPTPIDQGHQTCKPPDQEIADRFPVSFLNTLLALGHRVGNHTQDHARLHTLLEDVSASAVQQQVLLTHAMLKTVVPDELYVMRPPFLYWSSGVAAAINAVAPEILGPFGYDVNRGESSCVPSACADKFLEVIGTGPGKTDHGVILLHDRIYDFESAGDAAGTTESYDLTRHLVDSLRVQGYVFVPLDAIPGVLGPRRFGPPPCTGFCVVPTTWTSTFSDATGWDDYASYYRSIRLADIDGNGDDDICGRGAAGIWCAESNGSSFVDTKLWSSSFRNADGWLYDQYGTTIQFGDLDGDGDADVCGRGVAGLWCSRSMGKQGGDYFLAPTLWSQGDDFSDADGWGAYASYYGSFRLADVNGDGRADACARGSWGIGCALSNGSTAFALMTVWIDTDFTNAQGWLPDYYGSAIMFADLNGDGRADVCGRGKSGIRCALSGRGNVFQPSSLWIWARFSNQDEWYTSAGKYGSLRLADVNGDGRADLCGRNDTGVVCAFSDGADFSGYLHLNHSFRDLAGWSPAKYGTTIQLGDLNGDGLADLCGRGSAGIWCYKAAEALRAH